MKVIYTKLFHNVTLFIIDFLFIHGLSSLIKQMSFKQLFQFSYWLLFMLRLWEEKHGRPIIREAMSKTRFKKLLQCIRFDDKGRRRNYIFEPIERIF